MANDLGWQQEWEIDRDPLAAAQARHISTGYGLTLERIDAIGLDGAGRPFVAVLEAEDSRDLAFACAKAAGQAENVWIEAKKQQALALWRQLGLDTDPMRPLAQPLPCAVKTWRDDWMIDDTASSRATGAELRHSCGFAVSYHYSSGGDGAPGWSATVGSRGADQVGAVRAPLTEQRTERLKLEAENLRLEQGFFDTSPTPVGDPFGDCWRSLWRREEDSGDQWLVHASGLALSPDYGVVEDSGTKVWFLRDRDPAVDSRMRQKVGSKTWRRIREQGWQLCSEMGHFGGQPGSVH